MKRSKIGLIVVASLILNTALILQPIGVSKVEAVFAAYKGRIAFTSNRDGNSEIYLMDSDGNNQINLSNNDAFEDDPAWSPDGNQIVFRSTRSGNEDIWIMDADGSSATQLTSDPAKDAHPAWSPNGNQIVFASNRSGNYEIYTIPASGGVETQLTNFAGLDSFPEWSPDGQQIVYDRDMGGGAFDIFVMDADGSNQVNLTNTPAVTDRHSTWSVDGSKIAYSTNVGSGNHEVYVMDKNGSNHTRITNDEGVDIGAHWAPDSSALVFAGNRSGEYDIYKLDNQDVDQIRLTNAVGNDVSPAWQPIPNLSPQAAPDSVSTSYQTAVIKDILANDSDEESLDPANLTIHTQPTHGTAIVESGKVKYTPANNYVGTDQLTYQICDSFVLDQKCSTAVLSITVKPAAAVSKVGDRIIDNGIEKVVASSNRPTFSGTATPGSTVKVEIHSDPIILTTTADANGNWVVTPDQDLPIGDHTVYITATLNGVTTELDSFVLSVQQTIPNTGANIWVTRMGGGVLVLIGLSLAFWQRQRWQRAVRFQVPNLFP